MISSQGGTCSFSNYGQITVSITSGSFTVDVPFRNDGNVTIRTGILQLSQEVSSSGSFEVSLGSSLVYAASSSSTLEPSSIITGEGGLQVQSGTLTANGQVTIASITVQSGSANFGGPVSSSLLSVATGGIVYVNGPSFTVSNKVSLNGGTIGGSRPFTVLSGCTFTWSSGRVLLRSNVLTCVRCSGTLNGPGSLMIESGATLAISARTPIYVNNKIIYSAGITQITQTGYVLVSFSRS